MIIEGILELVRFVFIDLLLAPFEFLPTFPADIIDAINSYFDFLFSNCSLLGFFLPIGYVSICLGTAFLILQMDKLYLFTMWILKKIPILGIE